MFFRPPLRQATNLGALHMVVLGDGAASGPRWATAFRNPRRSPLTCCAVATAESSGRQASEDQDAIVVGDDAGWVAALRRPHGSIAEMATAEVRLGGRLVSGQRPSQAVR